MRAMSGLMVAEARLFMREPFAVFFTLLFPLLLLLIFGSAFGGQPDYPGFPGRDGIEVFVPQLACQVAGYLGLLAIPIAFAEYREMGVFRRLRATPVPLGIVLGAHLVVELVMMVVAIVLIMVVTALVFHLSIGGGAEILVALLAAAACMFALGLAIATAIPSARTAQAVGAGAFFPMLFLSGVAVPRAELPSALVDVGDVLPLTRVVDVVTHTWVGQSFGTYQWASVGIIAAYTVVGVAVTLRSFRW